MGECTDMMNSALTDAVSKRIRDRANELGVTQADVARATGAAKSTVNAWFNGSTIPRGENLNGLRKVLRCTQDWLFEGRGAPTLINADQFYNSLAASWEVLSGESPGTDLVKVPALSRDGGLDDGSLRVFHRDVLSMVSRTSKAAWFQAVGSASAPAIRDGDLLLIDTDVTEFSRSGSYYVIAVAGRVNIHRVFSEFDGSISIDDNERGERSVVKSEQINAIRVLGMAVYRSGAL